jgi:hypothetical protein
MSRPEIGLALLGLDEYCLINQIIFSCRGTEANQHLLLTSTFNTTIVQDEKTIHFPDISCRLQQH